MVVRDVPAARVLKGEGDGPGHLLKGQIVRVRGVVAQDCLG